jgi:hypothetical protein
MAEPAREDGEEEEVVLTPVASSSTHPAAPVSKRKRPAKSASARMYPMLTIPEEQDYLRLGGPDAAEEQAKQLAALRDKLTAAQEKLDALPDPDTDYAIYEKYVPSAAADRLAGDKSLKEEYAAEQKKAEAEAAAPDKPPAPAFTISYDTCAQRYYGQWKAWNRSPAGHEIPEAVAWDKQEKRVVATQGAICKTRNHILVWTELSLIAQTPSTTVVEAGARYLFNTLVPVTHRKIGRIHNVGPDNAPIKGKRGIASLMIPISLTDTPELMSLIPAMYMPSDPAVSVQIHAHYDNKHKFTDDGSAVLLETWVASVGVLTFGILYESRLPTMYVRKTIHHSSKEDQLGVPLFVDAVLPNFMQALQSIAADPKEYFARVGKRFGICVFCSKKLSDRYSMAHGYGEVCGKHYL